MTIRSGDAWSVAVVGALLALFAALTAHLALRLVAVERLDGLAYRAGVAAAALVGAAAGAWLFATRDRAALRRIGWVVALSAGAVVGVAVQAVLLLREPTRGAYAVGSWLTSADRALWLAVGVPFGAGPAALAAAIARLAARAPLSVASVDEADRWTAPFVVATSLLASLALVVASSDEQAPLAAAVLVATVAAVRALARERRRLRAIRAIFDDAFPGHELSPLEAVPGAASAPRLVGAVEPWGVVVACAPASGEATRDLRRGTAYRSAARAPVATVGVAFEDSTAPVRVRCRWLALALASAACALARHALL